MSQKGFALVYLLIGVLILAALGGAIYFGKPPVKLPNTQQTSTTTTPQGQNDASSIPNDTGETVYTEDSRSANWKTFDDEDLGFSMRYPNTWINTGEGIANSSSPMGGKGEKLLKKGAISIKFYPSKDRVENLDLWLDNVIKEYRATEGDPPYQNYQSKEMVVAGNGYQALKVKTQGYGQLNYMDYFILNPSKKEGIQISIIYPFDEANEQKDLINHILSTFKFN